MRILLNRKIRDKVGPLQMTLVEVLKEKAEVISKMQEVGLETRDLEASTTEEAVNVELQNLSNHCDYRTDRPR